MTGRIEPPVFLNDKGPGVSFYTSTEDNVRKLVMHGQVTRGAEPWCITLEQGDVRQLRDFCSAWLGDTAPMLPFAELPEALQRLRRNGHPPCHHPPSFVGPDGVCQYCGERPAAKVPPTAGEYLGWTGKGEP